MADHLRFGDVQVFGKVGAHHGAGKIAHPRLVGAEQRHPRGEQAAARKARRHLEGQAVALGQPRQVAPHVAALGRIDVEGRVVPAERQEHRAEQERAPRHLDAGLAGQRLDAHHRKIGVGAGEFEPELKGLAHGALPCGGDVSV
jgi:hypothetical protein